MAHKAPRWSQDIGYQTKIKPHNPNVSKGSHGLSGAKAEGKLSFSREATRKIARKDGADGIPASEAVDQSQWSEHEQEIAVEAEDMRRGLSAWFSESAATVRDYIQDCTPTKIDAGILCESIKAEDGLEVRAIDENDEKERAVEVEATAQELKAFKEKHRKEIGKRTTDIKVNIEQTIAILLFVMILEGCFNALLFKDAQSSGLMGGMLVAFGISAVNVTAGVLAGFLGLRYLNHPSIGFKIMGGVVATLLILFGLFLNFFVAHFRDAVEIALHERIEEGSLANFSMFDIPPGDVIVGMFPNIVGLENMVAYGLLFIGLAIFGIAVYEGYDKITDRYPGYGRVWRKERQALEKRQEEREYRRDELADYYTACRTWFDQQMNRHTEAKREVSKSINWLELRREEAQGLAGKIGDEERTQLTAYRQAHRRERNNFRSELGDQARCPVYFDDILTSSLPDFDYSRERQQADAASQTIEANITALMSARKWLDEYIQYKQDDIKSKEQKADTEAHQQATADNVRGSMPTGNVQQPARAQAAAQQAQARPKQKAQTV